jgi:hypothetical protein
MGVVNAIASAVEGVWNAIVSTAEGIWNGLASIASSAFEGVKSAIMSVVDTISGAVEGAFATLKGIVESAVSAVTGAWETISGIVTSITDAVTGIFGKVAEANAASASLPTAGMGGVAGPIFEGMRVPITYDPSSVFDGFNAGVSTAASMMSNIQSSRRAQVAAITSSATNTQGQSVSLDGASFQIFIGDTELVDLVDIRVAQNNDSLARRTLAGRRKAYA